MKSRPQSAIVSTFKQNCKAKLQNQNFTSFVQKDHTNIVAVSNRAGLNQIIPQMPAFNPKNNKSTALLYSKFIVKGINPKKIDLAKQSFNLRKQTLLNERKLAISTIKNKKSTRYSQITPTHLNTDKKSKIDNFLTFQEKNTSHLQNDYLNIQFNNFFHINKSTTKKNCQNSDKRVLFDKSDHTNENQIKINKSNTQAILRNRPKTANNQSLYNFNQDNRPKTASSRKNKINTNQFNIVFGQNKNDNLNLNSKLSRPFSASKLSNCRQIQTIQSSGFKDINFIQRNKRQLSASSKKNSLYITGVDNVNCNNIRNSQNIDCRKLVQKISFNKYKETLKINHRKKQSTKSIKQDSQDDIYPNTLSTDEIQHFRLKQIQRKKFMKENMPEKYLQYLQFIAQQQNGSPQMILLSKNLQKNQIQLNLIEKNQEQIIKQSKQYYDEFAGICQQTQYLIKKTMQKQQKTKNFNEILDILSCQKLLQMQTERQKIINQDKHSKQNDKNKENLTQINLNVYNIIKVLLFFQQKSEQMINKMLQNLSFDIITYQQNQIIIEVDSQIKYFYVILHGSVVKKTFNNIIKTDQDCLNPRNKLNYQNCITYVDGQTFGQPDSIFDKQYKYRIISQQKLLVLRYSYLQYRNLFAQNSKINDKIEYLKKIFNNDSIKKKVMTDEMLQIIAFQLQSRIYQAKQLIFRQNQTCSQLIFVSSGKIVTIKQHILKRSKKVQKDMKNKQKGHQNKIQLKNYSIKNYRRNFLNNYQILDQNNEAIIFYYQDISKQFISGDIINWQIFSHINQIINESKVLGQRDIYSNKNIDNLNLSKFQQKQEYKLQNSLMSNLDDTEIYTLSMKKFQKLPEKIKQIISSKYEEQIKKVNQKLKKHKKTSSSLSNFKKKTQFIDDIQKWDKYKQKLCQNVLKAKLKI